MDSLLRCRVVCKSWNSLIKSSPFVLSHLKYTLLIRSNKNENEKDDQFIFNTGIYREISCELYTLDCDHVKDEYTKRRVIPTSGIKAIYDGGRDINLEDFVADGTCNGLIFLLRMDESRRKPVGELIIWNPCVRRFLVLPNSSVSPNECFHLYKLGYDSHNNDFKIVQIVQLVEGSQTPYRFQVFSLLGGSWKEVNSPVDFNPYLFDFRALEICGALHWICGKKNCKIEHESTAIVTLNLSSELFGKMAIPEALKKRKWIESCHIHRYRESLALLLERTRGYDLWEMTEYGVAESWTKLVTIRKYPFYPDRCLGNKPLYFRKSGHIVVGTSHVVEQIDPEGKHVKFLVIGGREIGFIDPFLESLVLLDRSDAFSY